MSKRTASVILVLLLCMAPFTQVIAAPGPGDRSGIAPPDGVPAWTDPLDDMGGVYVPPGGLVGVEVSGGEVRLLGGHDEGWIASSIISCPSGHRYDLVVLEADVPGGSHINVTILDASKPPTLPGFANTTVPGYVNLTGTDVSVFGVDAKAYPDIRVQVNLFADGTDRPRLLGWTVWFIPLGEWHDDFLGPGKTVASSSLNFTGDAVELDLSGGGPSYPAYPPVVFPDSQADVDVFNPTTGNDGYQNGATIANTASTRGMDIDDLDGDGNLDLVLAMDGNTGSLILWGQDSGTWSTADKTSLDHADSGTDVAIGDFDGDGWKDVVISAIGGMIHDGSYVYLNNGDGTFDKDHDIKLEGSTISVDAGDLNNDGYDDILFAKSLVMDAPCYFGGANGPDTTPDRNFLRGVTMTSIGEALIEDVDKDGYLDVLFAVVDNRQAPIFLGGATGPDVTADIKLPVSNPPFDVSVGDVDADGYLDIAYGTFDANRNGRIEIFKGTSSGWDTSHMHNLSAAQGLHPVELVDIDVDGYDDIVTGDGTAFKVYMGGTSWPTAHTISRTGLTAPEDVAVGVPTGGGGGGPLKGYLVTEPIERDATMRWDILYLDVEVPAGTEVTVSLLDEDQDVIPGYGKLSARDVDISGLDNWRTIHVRLDMSSETNASTPSVSRLLVNWMDRLAWRDQFFGMAKMDAILGLEVAGLQLQRGTAISDVPDLVFASLRGELAYDTDSMAFLGSDGPSYGPAGVIDLDTQGADAVDVHDVNGDGIEDLVFASYGRSDAVFPGKSPLFLGSAAGWYGSPHHVFPTTGARDVVVDDLNDDGHADVVFAQERSWQGPLGNSTLFWGSASGWNATPDVEFSTSAASGVEAVDVNDDGRLDLVFACYEGAQLATDSMVFEQDANGYCGTAPDHRLATTGARAVASGDLDGDGHVDLVFANHYNGVTYTLLSEVFWGQEGGGFQARPPNFVTMGATDVKVADVDGDTHLDVVFANGRNASAGRATESYVFLNDGAGGFPDSPSARIPTEGAEAVEVADLDGAGRLDLVFACLNNGTSFRPLSPVYLGDGGGWPSSPDMLLPTVGAMDVIAVSLKAPGRGGFLSRPIAPDPKDDIGTFHTLRYETTLGVGDSGAVHLVDATTGEVLAETQLLSGPQVWDLRGLFSCRDHPSVRVGVTVTGPAGPTGFALDDLWLNWSRRVLNPPEVLDVGLSDTACYRTQTVTVTVEVTDDFDAPEALALVVEHQLVDGTGWSDDMIGEALFEDGLWHVDVSPDRFVPVGVYRFRVNVTDGDGLYSGHVELSKTLEVLPNLPGPPILLRLIPGNGAVTIEWRRPLDEGDRAVAGYRIHRGEAADALLPVLTVNEFTTQHIDEGLSNGVTYHYAIQAFNDLGNSSLSEVLNATPLGVPGIPTGLVAVAGDGSASLSWEAPLLDGGSPVVGYRIYRGLLAGEMEPVDETNGTTYTDEGLTNNVTYYYRVAAYNAVGEGLRSDSAYVLPLGLPDAPLGLTVTQGRGDLFLEWEPPLGTGGSPITGFAVYRGDAPDKLLTRLPVDLVVYSYTDEGLAVGETYHYAVAAITAGGEGPMSVVVSAMAIDVPGPPVEIYAEGGDGNVTLEWEPPVDDGASPVTGYMVLRGLSALDLEELALLGDVRTFEDTSVVNGVTYHYTVRAINAVGLGEPTAVVEATPFKAPTAPGAPGTMSVTVKDGTVTVTWTPPTDDGGGLVTGYIVLRGTSPDDLQVLKELGAVLSYKDEDVKPGTTYYYSVRAVNFVGAGPGHAVQEVKVPKETGDDDGAGWVLPMVLVVVIALVAVAIAIIWKGRQ